MQLSELKPGHFVRWLYKDNDTLLCRLRFLGRDYVSVQVVTATEQQVLESGYGVSDVVNVSPETLRPVDWKIPNA
ncbi:MAG: hypothetical protein DMG78_14920 [Acidobacteria bacterium]|nr:MAG: hypothetical protein DMG78_14920 [Acidobacteriota bacterium]